MSNGKLLIVLQLLARPINHLREIRIWCNLLQFQVAACDWNNRLPMEENGIALLIICFLELLFAPSPQIMQYDTINSADIANIKAEHGV